MAYLIPVFRHINVELFQCGDGVKFIVDGELLHDGAYGVITNLRKFGYVMVESFDHFSVLWNILLQQNIQINKIFKYKLTKQILTITDE